MTPAQRFAAGAILASASITIAGEFNLGFEHYTGYDQGADPLAGISFTIDTNESAGYADFTLALDAGTGLGTVKSIWFENGSGLGDVLAVHDTGSVDMRLGRGSRNPAGSNGELAWNGTDERLGRKGSAAMGIDAGESLTIRYAADSGFFSEGLNRLLAGESRIAFHLQRLGENQDYSAHFVSTGGGIHLETVPLPSAGLLAGAGLSIVGTRRRRR